MLGLSKTCFKEKCLNVNVASFFKGVSQLSDQKSDDVLRGTALDIYLLILKSDKPLGIREIQKTLNLSSPSVAQHHLARLESSGLVKREWGDYVINRLELENRIKISRFLIPRHFFYLLFAVAVLALEFAVLQPIQIYPANVFPLAATVIFIVIFCYETVKVWRKGRL